MTSDVVSDVVSDTKLHLSRYFSERDRWVTWCDLSGEWTIVHVFSSTDVRLPEILEKRDDVCAHCKAEFQTSGPQVPTAGLNHTSTKFTFVVCRDKNYGMQKRFEAGWPADERKPSSVLDILAHRVRIR